MRDIGGQFASLEGKTCILMNFIIHILQLFTKCRSDLSFDKGMKTQQKLHIIMIKCIFMNYKYDLNLMVYSQYSFIHHSKWEPGSFLLLHLIHLSWYMYSGMYYCCACSNKQISTGLHSAQTLVCSFLSVVHGCSGWWCSPYRIVIFFPSGNNVCKEYGCSHGCTEADGAVTCVCYEGLVLEPDQKTCIGM